MSALASRIPMEEPDEPSLTPDEVFTLLSNERRRRTIACLREREEPVAIRELTREIAALENDIEHEAVTYRQRKRVYTSLHQTHLPALSEAGVIDCQRQWEAITLTERADRVDVLLEVVQEDDIPWAEYYLGVSLLGVALVVGTWIGVPVLASISPLASVGALALVVAGSAVVQRHQTGPADAV